jgi:alkylhydroperoxidase family enzyme
MSIGTTFDETFGLRPDLYGPYQDFVGLFWHRKLVDAEVLELCRLRVAQLLRCAPEGVHAEPRDAAQQAAVAFAEQFVIDPHGVDDSMRARIKEHFSSAQAVALTEALAVFDGFTRFRIALCEQRTVDTVFDPAPLSGESFEVPDDADPALTNSVLGEQPETLVAFLRLYGTLWSRGNVPQPLKEIARLRNARITDCGY